jgi:hypothetical protein
VAAARGAEATMTEQTARQSAIRQLIRKAKVYLRDFDRGLILLVAGGLVFAGLYGTSAGTCPLRPSARYTASAQAAETGSAAAPARPAATGREMRANLPQIVPGPCGRGMAALLAILISLAALAIGAFAGFLFGLPRTLTNEAERARRVYHPEEARQTGHDAAAGRSETPRAADASLGGSTVNTNLEKISDWLTTIIVGVGLTNLPQVPARLDSYGDNVDTYFGFGGKVFAIAGGIYFLIAGFFLFYVLTRVKLSLVFAFSDVENLNAPVASQSSIAGSIAVAGETSAFPEAEAAASAATAVSLAAATGTTPVPVAATPNRDEDLRKADEMLLSKRLSDLKSTDEVLAWANAKARNSDFANALAGYRDLWGRVPFTEKMQTDYAAILAATGDAAGANNVVATLATTGLAPDAEREARQKVAAATVAGLRTRLQQGLYRTLQMGYEDAIVAGETLFSVPEQESGDAMAHIWLACAYGQKHAAAKRAAAAASPATAAQKKEMSDLAELAADQVARALALDSSLKELARALYDPKHQIGNDIDLQSLYPESKALNNLLDVQKPEE